MAEPLRIVSLHALAYCRRTGVWDQGPGTSRQTAVGSEQQNKNRRKITNEQITGSDSN